LSEKAKNVSASVRQRLLNLARERKDEFQLVLVRYGVERLLYRLSVSSHATQFVLKGAMLFQIWTGQPHRSTLDVDLLGSGSNDVDRLVKLFKEICDQHVDDDGLVFLGEGIQGGLIREDQRYGGVRIQLTAMLQTARIPIQIDIGFGDAITPNPEQVEYPTLLKFPAPMLRAYPRETVVAEKFEAMVVLGIANSRMKDFYDIWVLSRDFAFDGKLLSRAIAATFARRGTALPTTLPTAFTPDFSGDKSKQAQWSAFVRRGRLVVDAPSFEEVVTVLKSFIWPVSNGLAADKTFVHQWAAGGPWE
jgi:Nucleotidyl transferase AbiEii toxin, Type IV TA system